MIISMGSNNRAEVTTGSSCSGLLGHPRSPLKQPVIQGTCAHDTLLCGSSREGEGESDSYQLRQEAQDTDKGRQAQGVGLEFSTGEGQGLWEVTGSCW